jgi:hypothetical protein
MPTTETVSPTDGATPSDTPSSTATPSPTESPTPTLTPAPPFPVERREIAVDGDLADFEGLQTIDLAADTTAGGPLGADASPTLGGTVRIAYDADALYFGARVEDETHVQPHTGKQTFRGDSVQFAVSPQPPGTRPFFQEFNVALTPDGPEIFRFVQPGGSARGLVEDATATVERDDGAEMTTYEVGLPWDVVQASPDADAIGGAIGINDRDDPDADSRKGWVEWGGGIFGSKDSDEFRRLELAGE